MKNKYSTQKIVSIFCALILLVSCFGVLSACQPKHTCQNVCQDCGKCLNANCVEKACAIKCAGHHTCQNVCAKCGKCKNSECQESVCQDKCPRGHHECRSMCDTCSKCIDYFCPQPECVTKCDCPHTCESVCPTCNKCTDIYCKNPTCQQKCDEAPMIGAGKEYTGKITATESDTIVTTFTKGKPLYRYFWVYGVTGGLASSHHDYSQEFYDEYGVVYTFDLIVVEHINLGNADTAQIRIERHPCNIPDMAWTNVIYVYLQDSLAMEMYYCSPYAIDIVQFQGLIEVLYTKVYY